MRRQKAESLVGENREAFIRRIIQEKGMTVKEFAEGIEIPPPSLFSILKRGFDTTSVENVLRICDALEIDFEMFARNEYDALQIEYTERRGEIAQRLKKTRCLLRFRASAVADMLDVSLTYYRRFEGAICAIPPRCFKELAQIFAVPYDYLIGKIDGTPELDGLLLDGEPEDFEDYDLGLMIRSLRLKRKFTQAYLAELLGISLERIEQWENRVRVPSVAELIRLCEVFSTADDKIDFLNFHEYPVSCDAIHLSAKEVRVIEAYRKADEKDRRYADFALGLK